MIIISDEQVQAVRKWLPQQADKLIHSDDVNDLLDALDDLWWEYLDENQENTAESREIEWLRDHIHWDNTH